MGIEQILSSLPAVLIPIALVVYYTNQNNIKWMQERKEIIEALAAERDEWNDWQRATTERFFAQQEARFVAWERVAIRLEAMTETIRTEHHATRSRIQELMSRYESIAIPKQPRTGTADD